MPTGDFVFHIYDRVDNMIATTEGVAEVRYTPTPGQLTFVSSTRPDATVGYRAFGEAGAFEFIV